MILKRNFNPIKVAAYVWREAVMALVISAAVYVAHEFYGVKSVGLSFLMVMA
jgi:hypothetical protein